ncbi:MAG: DnaA/Hda family protein [Pseudomonadota bacterium]
MAEQLIFDLPRRTSMSRGDFFVSGANAAAVALMDSPDTWPNGRLVLAGPKGCGKSHLAHVWHAVTGAPIVVANALEAADIPALAEHPFVVIEDVDTLSPIGQTQAFHLLNLMMASGGKVMITARAAPAKMTIALKDLASRLQASGVAEMDDPDDALLAQVLLKLFADRQIHPQPNLIQWLLLRLERSFAAASDAVDRLDQEALKRGQNVNRALARDVLDH